MITRRRLLVGGAAAAALTVTGPPADAAGVTVRVGTHNLPPRAPRRPQILARLALLAPIWALTEQTDRVPAPPGWRVWRPERARSAAVMSHPDLTRRDRGMWRVSTPADPAPRFIVWQRFTIRGRSLTVGSVHLPAYPRHKAARARQAARCARWLAASPDRVLLGDFNADPNAAELTQLRRVAVHRARPTRGRRRIDHAWSARGIGPTLGAARTVATTSDHDALWLPVTAR